LAGSTRSDNRDFFYEGFSTPNGTFVPDDVFDVLAPRLSEAELRVLLYIVRRTFGFGKHADAISLKQLTEGITARDGRVLDHGTGMSRKGVIGGIKGLLGKGIINVHRRLDDRGENQINVYTLRFREGVVTGGNYGRYPTTLPPVTTGSPQDSVLQEPVGQQHVAHRPGGAPLAPAPGQSPVVVPPYRDPAHGRPDLYEQLKDLGVHHHTASKLLREHDHLEIEGLMEHVSARLQQGWTPHESVAAWLVAAVRGRYRLASREGMAAPAAQDDERQAQRRLLAEEVSERERERSAEELRRQRDAKLQMLGIEQTMDEMWQSVQARLRERDQWSLAMAMSYLKNIENGLAVLLVPAHLRNRLAAWQAEIEGVLAEVAGSPTRLVLHEIG
jgi:hypothetical protein